MTFVSLSFFAFLLCGIILFYVCPVKYRWVMLLGISIAFYAISGIEYLPFILFSTLSVFLATREIGNLWNKQDEETKKEGISREEKKQLKEKYQKKRKTLLLLALVLNIGILCTVKFTKFFIGPINSLIDFLGGEGEFTASMIIVPLGLSYYTFSVVGYMMDVYWKRYAHENSYLRFLLYAIYFPHILQGPIARYDRLGARLKQELRFDLQRVIYGIQLMLWGYFKKLVIADRFNIFIQDAFPNELPNHGLMFVVAMIFDVFYIYSDFSGCMDIARGVSQIFGIELDLNFKRPFLAKDVTEFWRRWHMSLGSWFKDYVYYPVSTSKLVKKLGKALKKHNVPRSVIRVVTTLIPVSVTWVLTGVWHGTGKTYVAWGIYYAILIGFSVSFSESYQKLLGKFGTRTDTKSWNFLRLAKVFTIFMGGRMLVTPGSLTNTIAMWKSIVTNFNPWIFTSGAFWELSDLDGMNMLIAVLSIILLVAVDITQEKLEGSSLREKISQENVFTGIILTAGLAVAIFIFGIYGAEFDAATFVYQAY